MESDILREIANRVDKGQRVAVATLTTSNGSIPGKIGSMLVVFENGETIGTVGGGKVEHMIIESATQGIKNGECFAFNYDMGEKAGLACGGSTTGFIKIYKPNKKLVIFGSGHVGRQIAMLAKTLEFDVYVIDDREEYKDLECFKDAKQYFCCEIKDAFEKINFDKDTYVVVTTRSHDYDTVALSYLLKYDLGYVGVIGSRRKVISVWEKLENMGISKEKLDSVHAPIGLKIDNGTPEEIAFSILSQVLMVKNNLDASPMDKKE